MPETLQSTGSEANPLDSDLGYWRLHVLVSDVGAIVEAMVVCHPKGYGDLDKAWAW